MPGAAARCRDFDLSTDVRASHPDVGPARQDRRREAPVMTGQLPAVVFFSVSAAIGGVGLLIYEWLLRHRDEVNQRLQEEFGRKSFDLSERTRLFKDLSRFARQSSESHPELRDSLQRVLEQSGLTLTPRHLLSLCVACAAGAGLIALLLSPIWWVRGCAMLLAF